MVKGPILIEVLLSCKYLTFLGQGLNSDLSFEKRLLGNSNIGLLDNALSWTGGFLFVFG